MNSFNFTGNLGNDCDSRFTSSGTAIATFNVAVRAGYGDHEKTSWLRCQLWGKRAEALADYLKKGQQVAVSGEFFADEWTDKDGNKRVTPSVNVSNIDLIGGKRGESGERSSGGAYTTPDTGSDVPFAPIF